MSPSLVLQPVVSPSSLGMHADRPAIGIPLGAPCLLLLASSLALPVARELETGPAAKGFGVNPAAIGTTAKSSAAAAVAKRTTKPKTAVKSIGAVTQAATGVKVATGLPGVSPAKKASTAAASPVPVASGSYTRFRLTLQDTLCTQGSAEDKVCTHLPAHPTIHDRLTSAARPSCACRSRWNAKPGTSEWSSRA